jgi:hypothetical protein
MTRLTRALTTATIATTAITAGLFGSLLLSAVMPSTSMQSASAEQIIVIDR